MGVRKRPFVDIWGLNLLEYLGDDPAGLGAAPISSKFSPVRVIRLKQKNVVAANEGDLGMLWSSAHDVQQRSRHG